jgi:signal transduction histidine kinase
MLLGEQVVGMIQLRDIGLARVFTAAEIHLCQGLTDQTAAAIENVRLYEAVRQQREELRMLNARLAEAEESERQWLARELHDQIGQNLTALGLNLEIIRSLLEDRPEPVNTRLEDAATLVKQMTQSVRHVMEDLRSPILDSYGLLAALHWYTAQFATRTGIHVHVEGEEPISHLVVAAENALFRIAQEALTNVAKHAEATEVIVSLVQGDQVVRLTVEDNGKGFDDSSLERPEKHRGWGLVSMTERAEAIGGRCSIETTPRGGTQVMVELKW